MRFSLTQLLMATALVPIVWMFTQAEGCGKRISLMESISTSSDGSQLMFSRVCGRFANVPGKIYWADLSRTITVFNRTDQTLQIVHQDYLRGNQGPAKSELRLGRTSSVLNPDGKTIVFHDFGGGAVQTLATDSDAPPQSLPSGPDEYVLNLAISKSGRFIATCDYDGLSVWQKQKKLFRVHLYGGSWLHAARVAFSYDDRMLAAIEKKKQPQVKTQHDYKPSVYGVRVVSTSAGNSIEEFELPPGEEPIFIEFVPDGTLIVGTRSFVRHYDRSGNILSVIPGSEEIDAIAVSRGGKYVALARSGESGASVRVVDMKEMTWTDIPRKHGATALAFLPDENTIVHGGNDGIATASRIATGETVWCLGVPGRLRPAWTTPAQALGVWVLVAIGISARRSRRQISGRAKM